MHLRRTVEARLAMFKLTPIPEAERQYNYVKDFIGGCVYYDDTRAADYLDGIVMPIPQHPVYACCKSAPLMMLRDGHCLNSLAQ